MTQPQSDMHKVQRRKNLTLMAVLVALMVLIFAISLMKMKSGS
jgi:predicted metal-binding membrane protein